MVPFKFRPELLGLLHDDSHLGMDKCVQRAKGCVYWPNITEDIKSMVQHCEKCLMTCRQNKKEPDIPIEIPIVTWKVITSDLFVFNDKTFILVIDLFSRFPVIRRLASESSRVVLEAIKDILCDFGMLETINLTMVPAIKARNSSIFVQDLRLST